MKKYVQNIEGLYAGQTANSLMLRQVDEKFPVLIPSFPIDSDEKLEDMIQKCHSINPSFPTKLDNINTVKQLNSYILDFNMSLQIQFRDKSHSELYMMDDTHNGYRKST